MAENLVDLVRRAFRQIGWERDPTDADVDTAFEMANDGVQYLALAAPFLMNEDRLRIQTQVDVSNDDDAINETDRISLVTSPSMPGGGVDPWVFQVDLPITTDGDAPDDEGQVVWAIVESGTFVARHWGGRMVDIIDDDGVAHQNMIRTVWTESVTSGGHTNVYARFSVLRPWPQEVRGTGPFKYRVYTQDYYLPDDLIQIRSIRIVGAETPYPLKVIGESEAEAAGYVAEGATSTGMPTIAWRGRHEQIPAPNVAPDAALADPADASPYWLGPEPPGEFEYVITYCFGKRPVDYSNPGIAKWSTDGAEWRETTTTVEPNSDRSATMRKREPLFESAPSPVSDAVTVANVVDTTRAASVVVTVPNIEYMQGFLLSLLFKDGISATDYRRESVGHSGWHVRIYRRRKSANFTNYTSLGDTVTGRSINALRKLDVTDAFYLLAEMRLDEFNNGRWFDDGTILPDYGRRLRSVNGYQSIRLWPPPNDTYEIEVRCLRRPPALVSQQDAPSIHPEATQIVVDYVKAALYEKLGNLQASMVLKQEIQAKLELLRKRYGDARPPAVPLRMGSARAYGYGSIGVWNVDRVREPT